MSCSGDVIIFKLPSDNSTDYVKRVIGVPGDNIQIVNGRVSLNGKQIREKKRIEQMECFG